LKPIDNVGTVEGVATWQPLLKALWSKLGYGRISLLVPRVSSYESLEV